MSNVVSSLVYTIVDRSGNPRTEGWFTCEFGEAYQGDGGYAGGIAFDLSKWYKGIDFITTQPISGSSLRDSISGGTRMFHSGNQVLTMPVVQDYSTPASARFQIWGQPMYPVPEEAILSGKAVASGFGITQLVSGPTASVSGIRFIAHVIGY